MRAKVIKSIIGGVMIAIIIATLILYFTGYFKEITTPLGVIVLVRFVLPLLSLIEDKEIQNES